jgi:8-oxo-dGTP pyrophosphatase MutT (NUDIX family)
LDVDRLLQSFRVKTRPPWFYNQSAMIPYRGRGSELEILLITSKRRRHWIIPKGVIDPGTTALQSGCKEAYEEAGVQGTADPRNVGEYKYDKWGGTCVVQVFALEVAKMLDWWPEADVRERKWMRKAEAIEAVQEPGLKQIISDFSPT